MICTNSHVDTCLRRSRGFSETPAILVSLYVLSVCSKSSSMYLWTSSRSAGHAFVFDSLDAIHMARSLEQGVLDSLDAIHMARSLEQGVFDSLDAIHMARSLEQAHLVPVLSLIHI